MSCGISLVDASEDASKGVSVKFPREKVPGPRASGSYPWHRISPAVRQTLPEGDIQIDPPGNRAGRVAFDWISIVFQPLGSLVAVAAFLIILHFIGAGMSMGLYMAIGSITGVLGILWGILRYRGQKKEAVRSELEETVKYRQYLHMKEEEILDSAKRQRSIMNEDHPSARICSRFGAGSTKLWNRPSLDRFFMNIRLGEGSVPLSRGIKAPEKSYRDDGWLSDEARELAEKYASVDHAPICCDLRKETSLGIVGERDQIIEQLKALIVQATAMHNYEDLKLVMLYPESETSRWELVRFLPHVFDNSRQSRTIAADKKTATAVLDQITDLIKTRSKKDSNWYGSYVTYLKPHYLVVVADLSYLQGMPAWNMLASCDPSAGISAVFLAGSREQLPPGCKVITELRDNSAKMFSTQSADRFVIYTPDRIKDSEWESYLHTQAPIRLENPSSEASIPRSVGFLEMLGVNDPRSLPLEKNWSSARPEDSMSVPLGVVENGETLSFDIHPSFHGAQGIFVGTNGSGKTSAIRAWILSMAVRFPPDKVSFVLVDFKTPGLLNDLADLPHIAGTVSNLDTDIERNLTALQREITRRETLFDTSGTKDFYDYIRKRNEGMRSAAEPLAFLFIVIDELNEFKIWSRDDAGSEWMTLLDKLYQTGRALGIHIVAGSQTPGPFTSVMESNANFRLCLRTGTESDSKTMLGTDDAFKISAKGRAILRVGDNMVYREFQPAFCDGPYRTSGILSGTPEEQMALVGLRGERRKSERKKISGETELQAVMGAILSCCRRNSIPRARQIWPERLPNIVAFDELKAPEKNSLRAVVGLADDPSLQARYALEVSLGESGSFLVYGSPRTGKTTFLKTMAASLLSSNDPGILEVYMIEGEVGSFAAFEAFPQVKGIAPNYDPAPALTAVLDILRQRKKSRPDKTARRVVLFVDGLNTLMSDHKQDFLEITVNGGAHGVYFVATCSAGFGNGSVSAVESHTKTGFCFWISQSAYDYKEPLHSGEMRSVPPSNIPGRGVSSVNGRVVSFQTAVIGDPSDPESADAIITSAAREKWGDYAAAAMSASSWSEPVSAGTVLIGQSRFTRKPVTQDMNQQTSLLIMGETYNARREAMRAVAAQVFSWEASASALIAVDMDREDMAELDLPEGILWMRSGPELDEYLARIREELSFRSKNPPPEGNWPPYIFFINDIRVCLENCSKDSINRIDKNLLLNGVRFSVNVITCCALDDYEILSNREEEEIKANGGSGKEAVPFLRLCSGRCLLTDIPRDQIPDFFVKRYSFDDTGRYYLGSGKAEPLVRTEKGVTA